jgi:predicted metalloprotease with PDZ domain
LWLVPDPKAAAEAFVRDRSGLATVRDGDGVKVSFVAANSPAAAAGWKAGDAIVAIDGRRTDDAFFANAANLGWGR